MSLQQDQPQCSMEAAIDSIFSDPEANVNRPNIPKLPETTSDYKKYYVPRVVSIGPYHFGKPKLQVVQKLKQTFTMELLKRDKDTLRRLYKRLGEPALVKELRSFYEEKPTTMINDVEFTKMMLLDSCFIVFYIRSLWHGKDEEEELASGRQLLFKELQSTEIFLVHVDILLVENQIPFRVVKEVINLMSMDNTDSFDKSINMFMNEGSIFATRRQNSSQWLESILSFRCWREEQKMELLDPKGDRPVVHLLDFFHRFHTKTVKEPRKVPQYCFRICEAKIKQLVDNLPTNSRFNFRNVDELVDLGIHFKPSNTRSLAHIEFSKGWWAFSATVKLPPLMVDDSTKPKLLNLAAYEMCSRDDKEYVTSYICLLDSLIDLPEDVKHLRKAWVLETYLGSDKDVAKLFNDISTELVPSGTAYLEAMNNIQTHYGSQSNRLFSQLKNEYFKSPWAIFALLGALIALFLTAVQTVYTVWSPKATCDDLCMFLKMNHHL